MSQRETLSERAFTQIQSLFQKASGITLTPDKRQLVQTRLEHRLRALKLSSFDAYCRILGAPENAVERQTAIDLLTTNESYFFREPDHYGVLATAMSERFAGRTARIWSAACATGEEPYSIAMTLLDKRPPGTWELWASDLSTRALECARLGVYSMNRLEHLPESYLKRFCMRGKGRYDGMLRMRPNVRQSVRFFWHNLLDDVGTLGRFDVIFLRNVLIYFDTPRKQEILSRLVDALAVDGFLFIGHAETLQGLELPLQRFQRSVFEKRGSTS